MHSEVRVGLCGWTIAISDYVREWRVVEVQQTFYDPPQDATLRRWRAVAPSRFEFTLKAWQLITHDATSPTYRRLRTPLTREQRAECGSFRDTQVVRDAWSRTLECARLLSATAVLLQCPRSFRPSDATVDRLRRFLATAPREGLRVLWEPRGDWPPALLRDLCAELDIAHVVDPFVHDTVTPERSYFRLHGITGARHSYTDEELTDLRRKLPDEWADPPYVMFNELPRADDARRFGALLRSPAA